MIITLENLDCKVQYEYEPPAIGGSHPDGSQEQLGANVFIYSVRCGDVELISIIEHDQLQEMESKILETLQEN